MRGGGHAMCSAPTAPCSQAATNSGRETMSEYKFPEGVAVVIGGSGGVGRAICSLLAASGCDVALTYRSNAQVADAVLADIRAAGRDGATFELDLSNRSQVDGVFEAVSRRWSRIHTVIFASGADISMVYLSQTDPDEWDRTISSDLTGFFNVARASLPHLRASRGSITAMTSAAIARHAQKDILSIAPKAAIEALLRGIAREEGRFGVRANSIALGPIETGLFHRLKERVSEAFMDAMNQNTALRRCGTAEEAAAVAVFLASSAASYVTGQSLAVDGGFSV